MVKIVKNPGNRRLNNLNDPVLSVLIRWVGRFHSRCCCVGENFPRSGIRNAVPPSSIRSIVTVPTELSQFSIERDFNKLKIVLV